MQAGFEPWANAAQAAAAVRRRTGVEEHDIAIVLGSGWLPAEERLLADGRVVAEIPLAELPGFPPPTVVGHGASLRSIELAGGTKVLSFTGRVHAYEGHPDHVVVHGVRVAASVGCRSIVLTNAAGGLREGMHVGQPVLISDHLNLTGRSPLTGPPPPREMARFVDLTDAWSPRLRELARSVEPTLEEGVYAGVNGPQYETPAEIRMFASMGADLVGMSTVHEAIAAREAGLELLGLSLVSNLAAGTSGEAIDHADVIAAGQAAAERMGDLLAQIVTRL